MRSDNFFTNSFIDMLCRNRYDVEGNDLAKKSLYDLKNWVSDEDFNEATKFYFEVTSFYRLATEENVDIEDPKNIAAAQKYENLVDTSSIQPENKAALYDTLLGFIDINGGNNKWYMDVLQKKVAIMQQADDYKLNLAAKQAYFHNRGKANRPIYLNIMHAIYEKMTDKTKFKYLSELGIVLDKGGKKIVSATKMTPQQRLERLSIIEAIIKHPLEPQSRIQLLEEGIKLAANNLRKRSENFETKSKFYTLLQEDYTAIGDPAKANKCGLSSYNFNKSSSLALEYGLKKHKTNC